MLVTPKYLDRFKLTFAEPAALLALKPQEVDLNGFEQVGTSSITLDPPTEGDFPHSISLLHRDDNAEGSESWELDAGLRQTLVRVDGDATKGYLFSGLIAPADARAWFRNHLGIEAAQA